jgi:hypothetical protein
VLRFWTHESPDCVAATVARTLIRIKNQK